jgi:hypothetical protein
MNEKILASLVHDIYNIISGADNTEEYNSLCAEIEDWLRGGDQDMLVMTAEELAAEFNDYRSDAFTS